MTIKSGYLRLLFLWIAFLVAGCAHAGLNYLVVRTNATTGYAASIQSMPELSIATSCPLGFAIHRYGLDDAVGFINQANIASGDSDAIFGPLGSRIDRGVCIAGVPPSIKLNKPVHASTCNWAATASTTILLGGAPVHPIPCANTSSNGMHTYALVFPDQYVIAAAASTAGYNGYYSTMAGIIGRSYVALGPPYTPSTVLLAYYFGGFNILSGPLTNGYICSFDGGFSGSGWGFGSCVKDDTVYYAVFPRTLTPRQGGANIENFVYQITY